MAEQTDGRGPVFAGLDGGGTRTVCVAYCPGTGALGTARAGPLNTNFVPPQAAREAVRSALASALAAAGLSPAGVSCVAAAAPWSEALVQEVAGQLCPGALVLTTGEDVAALLGGTLRPHGLVLISGTGSRCAYVPPDRAGPPLVVGAWGSLFGDEGSGYDIGRAALRAVARAWDGRGPATELFGLVAASWSLREREDLVSAVYGSGPGGWRAKIASLCPLVGQAAAHGDAVAVRIIEEAAAELALMVETVVVRAGLARPAPVLVSGGVFGLGETIIRPLAGQLSAHGVASVVRPLMPPVYGALLAAIGAGGRGSPPGEAGLDRVLTPGLVRRLVEHSRRWDQAWDAGYNGR